MLHCMVYVEINGEYEYKIYFSYGGKTINYTTSLFCEIDKYAATSYCAVHGVDPALNLGDIIKADEKSAPNFNVMVGGSPCQDFSIAGKQGGRCGAARIAATSTTLSKPTTPREIAVQNVDQ